VVGCLNKSGLRLESDGGMKMKRAKSCIGVYMNLKE
jgi:hypothetical protein